MLLEAGVSVRRKEQKWNPRYKQGEPQEQKLPFAFLLCLSSYHKYLCEDHPTSYTLFTARQNHPKWPMTMSLGGPPLLRGLGQC